MEKKQSDIINTERKAEGLTRLSEGIAPLLKKLLGKQGLAEIEILSNWINIVGEEIAEYSLPQKIEFKSGSRNGGILHLIAAGGAFALEIQHKTPIILEKVNTFFGYRAVEKIKIIQNNTFLDTFSDVKNDDKTEKKLVSKEQQTYISGMIKDVQNPDLKARLQSLGESIAKKDN